MAAGIHVSWMELIGLGVNLLEKVSVLVAAALVLVLLRPAEVWLSETGRYASFRRRLFIFLVFTPLAVLGVFLGFELGATGFNTRAVGVIVAGFLGGRLVGIVVGACAGGVAAYFDVLGLGAYLFAASLIDGAMAGWIARRFGMKLRTLALGAIATQLVHHMILGLVFWAIDPAKALRIASDLSLHTAKIGANTIGVIVFMGLLNLTREVDAAKRAAEEHEASARQAHLEALQYQLKPHFLFNLLNTLAYLIRTDAVRARELTLELSDFLRYTLSKQDQDVPLREELEQIERYIELERARFGQGLHVVIHPPDPPELTDTLRVPPLLLQPLVENAIKHGAHAPGEVSIQVRITQHPRGEVVIEVEDRGPGPPLDIHETLRQNAAHQRHRSLGLQNVQERLARFFEHPATLTLEPAAEGGPGTIARITLDGSHDSGRARSLKEQARQRLGEFLIQDHPRRPGEGS